MSTLARTVSRQITWRYLAALLAVAALSIGAHVALGALIRTEALRVGAINLSGRQRMLTQRIALDGRLLGEPLTPQRRAEVRGDLRASLETMRRSHDRLVRGDRSADTRGLSSPRLRAVYFSPPAATDRRTREFLRDGEAMLAHSGEPLQAGDPHRRAVLQAATGPLMRSLDQAVGTFERQSAADVRHLEEVSRLVLVATLAVLLLEGLFVFRPLVRRTRRRTESLAVAESRLRAVVENALVGVVTLDRDARIVSTNPTACGLFGRGPAALRGCPAEALVAPGVARDTLASLIDEALADRALPACELVALTLDDEPFAAEVAVSAARTPGDVTLVMLVTDVTDRKQHEAELSHRALHDPLTGLPNRGLLLDRLAQAQARLMRTGGRLALLFIDLDRFKVVNDSLGHDAGDHLLVAVARRLEPLLRGADTLARFGGDEFLVLCDGCASEADAVIVAERVLSALAEPFELPGDETVFVGASVGIAMSDPDDGDSPDTLIGHADSAMYRAKRRGGHYEVYDSSMPRRSHRLDQETALRRAVERHELELFYQPIVSLESLEVQGYEALVRWRRPESGLVAPGEFIPLAEDTGLIVPMGDWVIAEACRQAIRWRASTPSGHPITVAVNVAPAQLERDDLVETIRRILAEVGAAAPGAIRLGLEITERTLAADPDRVQRTLLELREMGVSVSLDDFGTGYSTLANLKRFSFDAVKIDRTFVNGLGGAANDGYIADAVIRLGRAMGLTVIAEGIETQAELERLRELGCPLGQGYLFARPLPAADVRVGPAAVAAAPTPPPPPDRLAALSGSAGGSEGSGRLSG